MGMTIDEHIKVLESLFKGRKGFTGQPIDFQGSVDFAIDTLRKYQEQTKHLKALQRRCFALTSGTICLFCPMECVARKEVEDGNDRT